MSADSYSLAVEELTAAQEERTRGPKDQIKCPDCGATLSITATEDGRFEVKHIKHST